MTASKPVAQAGPDVAPRTASWDLRVDPFVLAEFPAELVMITVGVTFYADVRGLVPDDGAGRFWDAFWADFGDTIEATMRASVGTGPGTGSPAGLETARQTARQMLADRFAEVAGTSRV